VGDVAATEMRESQVLMEAMMGLMTGVKETLLKVAGGMKESNVRRAPSSSTEARKKRIIEGNVLWRQST
jgi:hypothetical protein